MTNKKLNKRVARGARLLDEKVPDWADRIFRDRLSLGSTCNCVVGQLFVGAGNPYLRGITFLFGDDRSEEAVRHGFDIDIHGAGYTFADLTQAWLLEIEARSQPEVLRDTLQPIRETPCSTPE